MAHVVNTSHSNKNRYSEGLLKATFAVLEFGTLTHLGSRLLVKSAKLTAVGQQELSPRWQYARDGTFCASDSMLRVAASINYWSWEMNVGWLRLFVYQMQEKVLINTNKKRSLFYPTPVSL